MTTQPLARRLRATLFIGLVVLLVIAAGCRARSTSTPTPAPPTAQPTQMLPTPAPLPPSPTPLPPSPTPLPPAPTPVPPSPVPQPKAGAQTPVSAEKPDPAADPLAALVYSSSPGRVQSGSFTYDMQMKMAPADDASTQALGPAAAILQNFGLNAEGSGVMKITDPETGRGDMRMQFNTSILGQQIAMEMVLIGDTVWMRLGDQGPWQKTQISAGSQPREMVVGMDAETMLKMIRSATDVRYIGREELDGEPVHHLRFRVAPNALDLSSLLGRFSTGGLGSAAQPEMLKDMTVEADVLLGADDLLVREEKTAMKFTMAAPKELNAPNARLGATIDMTMRLGDLNQPVTIAPPKE